MRCVICDKEGEILHFVRDDAVLSCNHKQASDPVDLIIEQAVYETEKMVEAGVRQTGLSEHEVCERLIEIELEAMPRSTKVRTLRVLHRNNLDTPATKRVSGRLSSISQRYISGK